MKKILFIAFCLGISVNLFAQNTFPFPSSGDVGIGTTTPITTLEVKFNTNNSGLISAPLDFTGDQLVIRNENTTTGVYAGIGFVGNVNELLGRIGFKRHGFGNGRGEFFVAVDDAGVVTEALTINKNGKVGIGNTSPYYALDIQGTGAQGVVRINNSGTVGTQDSWIYYSAGGVTKSNIGYRQSTDALTFRHYAADRMVIKSNGHVGIGTTSPGKLLELGSNTGAQGYIRLRSAGSIYEGNIYHTADYSIYMDTNTNLRPIRIDGSALITGMTGNVGVGTLAPSEKLEVIGNARVDGEVYSKKVKVTTNASNWPDYVFESDYQLTPLSQLEAYVKTNQHLPGVPSAKEVEAKGQDLGDIQATLLKKVEELTLYVIEQDKKQLSLEERLKKLEAENAKLKALLKKE